MITLDSSSITPTKFTLFIPYISIPFFSYMFRCISRHLQGEFQVGETWYRDVINKKCEFSWRKLRAV